jgi:hypothetical protein
MKYAILTVLLFTQLSAGASETTIQCYYHFTNETLNLLEPMRVNACHGDLVWGKSNVCFTGSVDEIVEMMNAGDLNRRSAGLIVAEAQKVSANHITYIGIDQQSFWQKQSDLLRCK